MIDNLKRASEVEGVKLKEGKVQGVKSIGRKKVDISGLDTSDLTAAVAKFEKETDEICFRMPIFTITSPRIDLATSASVLSLFSFR